MIGAGSVPSSGKLPFGRRNILSYTVHSSPTISSTSPLSNPPDMIAFRTSSYVDRGVSKGGMMRSFVRPKRNEEEDNTCGTSSTDSDIDDSLSSLGCDYPHEWAAVCASPSGSQPEGAHQASGPDRAVAGTETNERSSPPDLDVARHVELKLRCAELELDRDRLSGERRSLHKENERLKRAASAAKEDRDTAQAQVKALRLALYQSQKKYREASEERDSLEEENERLRAENGLMAERNEDMEHLSDESRSYQEKYDGLQRIMDGLLRSLQVVTESKTVKSLQEKYV